MIELTSSRVPSAVVELFDATKPTMLRAFNVLDGFVSGQVVTDDPERPTWAAVREATFGTLYLGGDISAEVLATLVEYFRRSGEVGIGFWPDDPLIDVLPPNPAYDGRTLYFSDRSQRVRLDAYVGQLLSGCRLSPRDRSLIARSPDYELALASFGTVDSVLAHTLGVVLLRDDVVLCEAATGAPAHGRIEVGVTTQEGHRRRGYATVACARLIQACEAAGYQTWWDCAKQNQASVALARKLGYQNEREYRYLLWPRQ